MVKFMDFSRPFECFSSSFQSTFNFQGLFKTVLYIQVLFKPVGTLLWSYWQHLIVMFKISNKAICNNVLSKNMKNSTGHLDSPFILDYDKASRYECVIKNYFS